MATRCKQLTHLTLEHTGVGDEGVLAAARGLPLLQGLTIANYTRCPHCSTACLLLGLLCLLFRWELGVAV